MPRLLPRYNRKSVIAHNSQNIVSEELSPDKQIEGSKITIAPEEEQGEMYQ